MYGQRKFTFNKTSSCTAAYATQFYGLSFS